MFSKRMWNSYYMFRICSKSLLKVAYQKVANSVKRAQKLLFCNEENSKCSVSANIMSKFLHIVSKIYNFIMHNFITIRSIRRSKFTTVKRTEYNSTNFCSTGQVSWAVLRSKTNRRQNYLQ